MNNTQPEIYPMPSFLRLAVADIDVSAEWYRTIGFADIFTLTGPTGKTMMSHLRWAKYADIMLVPRGTSSGGEPSGSNLTIYFTVDRGNVDRIAEIDPASVIDGPVLQPWNAREVILSDPDGFRIAFAEQGDTTLGFEEVMQRVKSEL